jgi:hypothetical protein
MNLFTADIAIDPIAQRLVRTWTGALRSGRFRQATGRLRTDDGWCVLGIACHTYDVGGWHRDGEAWSYLGCRQELPAEVVEAFRLRTARGRYGPLGACCLLHDNDESGRTFPEFADLIERQLVAAIARRRRWIRRRGTSSRPGAGARGAGRCSR